MISKFDKYMNKNYLDESKEVYNQLIIASYLNPRFLKFCNLPLKNKRRPVWKILKSYLITSNS